MSKYKTFEELKEELGNNFDEYMYKTNIELLTKIEKAVEYIKEHSSNGEQFIEWFECIELLNILRGNDK